tara:strand:- start:3810 stop:4040 length:231 start_codon:yes stop_codon:yes gene_type:complete
MKIGMTNAISILFPFINTSFKKIAVKIYGKQIVKINISNIETESKKFTPIFNLIGEPKQKKKETSKVFSIIFFIFA